MSGKRNKRTSQSAISTMHLKRRFQTPSSSISIQNAELFGYLNFDETSFYLQSSFIASKCGWTSLWPKLSQVHDSYAVFSSHLPAWLYSAWSGFFLFHHNWSTCLKVCLKPMKNWYRRITANNVAQLAPNTDIGSIPTLS